MSSLEDSGAGDTGRRPHRALVERLSWDRPHGRVVACRLPKRRTHAGHSKSAKGLVGSEDGRFPFRPRRVGECLEAVHSLVRICARSLFKDADQLPDIVCEEALLGGSLDRVFDEILGEPLLTCALLVRYFSESL